MAFHETRFPTRISYGSTGGPGFNTALNVLGSGQDERVARWATPKHRFNVVYGIKTWDDMNDLRSFYLARHGIANGFRYFDWMDHTSAANGTDAPAFDDQVIGTGDGSTTVFQLRKTYSEGGNSRVRVITKPIDGETIEGAGLGGADPTYNVLVGINGTNQASGWTVNTTDGTITFSSAPGAGLPVTSGFAFDVPVYFGVEMDNQLPMNAESFDNADIDDIPLIEFVDPTTVDEDVYLGGAYNHGLVEDTFSITMAQGRVHTWADNSGEVLTLPAVDSTPLGGPIFYLINTGTGTTSVRYSDGSTLLVNAAQDVLITIVLGLDAGGGRVWYAV